MDRRESLKDRQLVELGALIPRAKKGVKVRPEIKVALDLHLCWRQKG
jgi:hypothetical protein